MTFRLLHGEIDLMTAEAKADFDNPGDVLYKLAGWLDENPSVVPISLSFFYDSLDDEWAGHLTVSNYGDNE